MTTSVLNGLSSINALALSKPETIASLVALGVVATGTISVIVYKKWEQYEDKKHKDKIEFITRLHKKHLKNLVLADGTLIPDLPQIFQFNTETKTIDSLHYNDDEVADIGSVLPSVPVVLTRYRQFVLDALLKLKEYYFNLEKSDDVTAGVLSYLMNILQNRCLGFVGYDYDITYLKAITTFINHYASRDGKEKSAHFDRLKQVYTFLTNARQDLEKHKESMSLQELVDEARNACLDESNKLIRLLVKMVTPEKYQQVTNTVTHTELEQDVLRKKYIDFELWGLVLSTDKEIELPKSIFHDWIKGIASYYLLSQTPHTMLNAEKILRPQELFTFTEWAKAIQTQMPLTKKDKLKLRYELDLIHKVFKNSPNFINSKLVKFEKEFRFVIIEQDDELLETAETMAHFAHLIHGIISLQALCADLTNSMEQLGLDFFDDQNNYKKVFVAFNTIYNVIDADLQLIQQKLLEISVANKNTMRIASKMQFQNDVDAALNTVKSRLLKLADNVRNYRNKHPKLIEVSVKEALSAADFFQRMYDLNANDLLPEAVSSFAKARPEGQQDNNPSNNLESEMVSPSCEEMEFSLDQLNSSLYRKVSDIIEEKQPDAQGANYQKIYDALNQLHIKSIALLHEKNPNPDRWNKIINLHLLMKTLYGMTMDLLSHIPEERIKATDEFVHNIHTQLHKVEHCAFIDRHQNSFSKFIYENFGFFKTATRNKLCELEKVCDNLQSTPNP